MILEKVQTLYKDIQNLVSLYIVIVEPSRGCF